MSDCEHLGRVPLDGYTMADEHARRVHDDGDPELDAVDYCRDCGEIRLWGVGWITPPPPSPETKQRLEALRSDGNPCKDCGVLLGEAANCMSDECLASQDNEEEIHMSDEILPKDVDDVMLAFPANVVGEYLPDYDNIPDDFKRTVVMGNHPCAVADALFMGTFLTGKIHGARTIEMKSGQLGLIPKEGIDPEKAFRHISACLGSYQPKHEHKIAGVAYLISLWFKAVLLDNKILWKHDDVEIEGAEMAY